MAVALVNGIEMENLGPARTYKKRFASILTERYDDERSWLEAAEALLKKDEDFEVKVVAKLQEEGEEPRKQAIVEVMVDLLLDMERITEHKGLVYVLDEGLKSYPMELMACELLKRGADPNRDDYGYTPLLIAVIYSAPDKIIDLLLKQGADVSAVDEDKKCVLHFAAQNHDKDVMQKMIEKGVRVDAEDKDGKTALHEAAYYGSEAAAEVLIEKGASVNARDHRKQTPLHVATEKGEEELIKCLLDKKADSNITDLDGNTPLDLAAKEKYESAFNLLLTHAYSSKKDDAVKKTLKRAMTAERVKDDLVREKIGEMSPFGVISLFKRNKCGGEEGYVFLKHFAKNSKLRKSTKAIMDQFVLGRRRVNCEIIEADEKGNPPDEDDFDGNSQSLLDIIGSKSNKELAQHPAVRALMDYKWRKFGRLLFALSFVVYLLRMLFFGLALLIAARPDLDNPGCYRNGWDYFRGVCEGISLLFFLFILGREIRKMFSFPKGYFKDYYNYLQLLALILPFLIIPFRAATTWCASTGVGYCAEPTLLSNSTNITLDINQACITASHVQWIFASLAYMANAVLVVEFLALFRTTGVYVRILLKIIVSDVLKFLVIFIVALYIFVGSFYLALRAGVSVNTSTGAITSDLQVFQLQTLYPWHVVFTGFRILIEFQGIFDGDYFANDDNGQYIGYQWFSIVLYLTFLFAVIVVLLNLLIAQMSDTYAKVQEDVEGTFAIARARTIARLQKEKLLYCKETYWKKYYSKYLWIDLSEEEQKQQQRAHEQDERLILIEQKLDNLTAMVAQPHHTPGDRNTASMCGVDQEEEEDN